MEQLTSIDQPLELDEMYKLSKPGNIINFNDERGSARIVSRALLSHPDNRWSLRVTLQSISDDTYRDEETDITGWVDIAPYALEGDSVLGYPEGPKKVTGVTYQKNRDDKFVVIAFIA